VQLSPLYHGVVVVRGLNLGVLEWSMLANLAVLGARCPPPALRRHRPAHRRPPPALTPVFRTGLSGPDPGQTAVGLCNGFGARLSRNGLGILTSMLFRKNAQMVDAADALAGRTDQTMPVPESHFVNGHPLVGPGPTA